jgi:hypothetical protein
MRCTSFSYVLLESSPSNQDQAIKTEQCETDKQLRIALVITELDPGGPAEKCLTQLACCLKSQGHAVHAFALQVAIISSRSVGS